MIALAIIASLIIFAGFAAVFTLGFRRGESRGYQDGCDTGWLKFQEELWAKEKSKPRNKVGQFVEKGARNL